MRAREKDPRGFYEKYGKDYYAKNKERIKKNDKKRYLKKLYGITIEQYEEMLTNQKGGCAICGEKNKNGKYLFVDHDHATGKVRGLLCVRCNFLVGSSRESIGLLEKALDYIRY